MRTMREVIRREREVELLHVWHRDDPSMEAFHVKDRRRTPEDWVYNLREEANAKFEERIQNTMTEPPLLR